MSPHPGADAPPPPADLAMPKGPMMSTPPTLAEPPPPAYVPANPVAKPVARKRKRALIALAGIAVVAAMGAAGGGTYLVTHPTESGPTAEARVRAAIDDYYADWQRGDLTQVRADVTDDVAKAAFDVQPAAFADYAKRLTAQNGRFVVNWFDDVEVDGDRARVAMTGHSIGGELSDIGDEHPRIELTRIDGMWRISKLPSDPAAERKRTQMMDEADVQQTVQSLFDAANTGNLVAAHNITEIDAVTLAALKGIVIRSVDRTVVNSDSASITVTIQQADVTQRVTFQLERIGGQWRIVNAAVLNTVLTGGAH
ncbi:hypothetical protein ACQP1G_27445 [Nocardia sp. CA-107356]|uniref:Rv0361 family membrane protein n=1 Tax=Nocardia sp. CA-107356 TaxID=3239972 RepID=UPI003D90DDC8